MAQTRTTSAEVIGGPHDGALVKDISVVELRANQIERWGDVYVLSILHSATEEEGQMLQAYHPAAVKILRF